MNDETMKPQRTSAWEAFLALAFTAIIGTGIWAIFAHPAKVIPDWIFRDSASTSPISLLWTVLLLAATAIIPALILGARMPRTAVVAGMVGGVLTSWYMVASIKAVDFEGDSNPYVRAREASPGSYDDLAALSKDARVAALIRKARADGRITQGEAYDITHSPAYMAAWEDSSRRRMARTKQTVLDAG